MSVLEVFLVVGLLGAATLAGPFVFLLRWVRRTSRERNRMWQKAGRELGLEFRPATLRRGRRLRGRVQGLRVETAVVTERRGKTSRTCTRFRALLPEPGLGLRIRGRNPFDRFTGLFLRDQVRLGDPAFDEALLVRARDTRKARRILDAETRQTLLRAFRDVRGLSITDGAVVRKQPGQVRQAAGLVAGTRSVVELALALLGDEAPREASPQGSPEPVREPVPSPGGAASAVPVQLVGPGRDGDPANAPQRGAEVRPPAPTRGAEDEAAPSELPGAAAPAERPAPAASRSSDPAPPRRDGERPTTEPAQAGSIVGSGVPEAPVQDPGTPAAARTGSGDELRVRGASPALEVALVARDLFGERRLPSQVEQLFRERYQDRAVRATGRVAFVEGAFDEDGNGPRVRLRIDLADASCDARVVVLLPQDGDEPATGERELTFVGRLAACDALVRILTVVGAPHSSAGAS